MKKAFTLIEMSISLVIIALLVGGVLIGRDLIEGAKLRQQVTQIEKYKTAINVFSVKFNCIPGDCSSAETLGLGTSANLGAKGDGDKIIRSYTHEFNVQWWLQSEKLNFWYHLAAAALIEGTFKGYDTTTNPPDNTSMKGYHPVPILGKDTSDGVCTAAAIIPFNYGGRNGLAITNFCTDGYSFALTAQNAYALDVKLDDGLPKAGNIVILSPYSGISPQTGGARGCKENGNDIYDLRNTWNYYTNTDTPVDSSLIECGLLMYGGF